ncbi:hypothetical protein [Microbacterium sp. Ru50]|uniref:hypothetical protein n=1 Tax=Microbacterium sp. Ru50 TaxID=2080744 RepID=UPI0011AF7644|nr:hypothetical protein [Microbacterium sp. Ru50]
MLDLSAVGQHPAAGRGLTGRRLLSRTRGVSGAARKVGYATRSFVVPRASHPGTARDAARGDAIVLEVSAAGRRI